jgi:hypothetical protein
VAGDEAYGQDYKFRTWCERRRPDRYQARSCSISGRTLAHERSARHPACGAQPAAIDRLEARGIYWSRTPACRTGRTVQRIWYAARDAETNLHTPSGSPTILAGPDVPAGNIVYTARSAIPTAWLSGSARCVLYRGLTFTGMGIRNRPTTRDSTSGRWPPRSIWCIQTRK